MADERAVLVAKILDGYRKLHAMRGQLKQHYSLNCSLEIIHRSLYAKTSHTHLPAEL